MRDRFREPLKNILWGERRCRKGVRSLYRNYPPPVFTGYLSLYYRRLLCPLTLSLLLVST
nr:MAG TPA: hypothetical protein [Caudoviricetes sp.]